ncbi:hypothetical protein [Spirosoma sp.]|uniref:hypothetical protein n=1 Tax=Spirosoma sp. TaxID=1899569 RepID=UPI0026162060|nr:hypothetical protein [Spirosoma sp.]MCX6218371.1 hypothetical protein [Spirosoma sp.]
MLFSDNFIALSDHLTSNSHPDIALMKKVEGMDSNVNATDLYHLLLNSWSAEYALRITPVVNDEQYLQSSLHWTFPQAYYSVLFSARAFLRVMGSNLSNEENIVRKISSYVSMGVYPKSLSFYMYGTPDDYKVKNLTDQLALTHFLATTRERQFEACFKAVQMSPSRALRDYNGHLIAKLDTDVCRLIGSQVNRTTYFDLMQRLRISTRNREIEQLVLAEMGLIDFHSRLTGIVSHINSVHECYVAQCLGLDDYRSLVDRAPSYLRQSFVLDRLETLIVPNMQALQPAITANEPVD